MSKYDEESKQLICSFYGKPQGSVKRLIAGRDGYICDECIGLCTDIIREEFEQKTKVSGEMKLPIPKEIAERLSEYVVDQDVRAVYRPERGDLQLAESAACRQKQPIGFYNDDFDDGVFRAGRVWRV